MKQLFNLVMRSTLLMVMIAMCTFSATYGQSSGDSFFENVRSGETGSVKQQLLLSFDPSIQNANGHTPLMFAVNNLDHEMIDLLLEFGADVNVKDDFGQTALMYASVKGDTSVVGRLIRKKADINAANHKGKSSLTLAAREKHYEVVKMLLFNEAEVNHQDDFGWSALHFASFKESFPITDILLKFRADPLLKDNHGKRAIIYAAAGGYMDILERLRGKMTINHLNAADDTGWVPIHYAAYNGRLEAVKYLVSENVDYQKTTPEGTTAFEFSRRAGHVAVANYLKSLK